MCHPLKVLAALLALSAALTACSKFSLLTQPLDKPADVEVRSMREGDTLHPGDPVRILLHAEDEGEVTLQVRLTDVSGKSVWESTLDSPLLNEELELLLPELPLGQYRLLFRVTGGAGTASEKSVAFFYAPGEYRVLGIQSYPPSLLPGASTVLKAQLKVPENANPFLRWTLAGAVVARGTLRDGFDQIHWPAPAQEGIYPVQVELFPVPPVDGAEYTFKASASLQAQLYVTRRKAPGQTDLSPESSYFSLFHFNGDLADSAPEAGGSGGPAEAEPIGAPNLVVVQEKVGYQVRESSGLRLPRWILPLSEGRLQPFTLTMGLILQPSDGPKDLLTLRSREGDFLLQIRTSAKELSLLLQAGERKAELPSGFAEPADGREHFISLSVEPAAEGLRLQWFLDGRQTAAVVQPLSVGELSGAGECRVGGAGSGGFSGVITELGVYFRDEQARPATDAAVYRRAMEARYRQELLFADGFDGMFPVSGLKTQGTVGLRLGILSIAGAGTLELPAVALDAEGISLELALAGDLPPRAGLRLLWAEDSQPFLEIRPEGALTLAGKEHSLAGADLHRLRVELGPSEKDPAALSLRIEAGREEKLLSLKAPAALQPPGEPKAPAPAGFAAGGGTAAAGLRVQIVNPPADSPELQVERVLLLRGRDLP